ncbi:hypothetical protein [Halobacterium wangiae]|uniref:hypothetical protein n=1 Tax=Halobacterium wangiae TaxID=2902623 RepID=UPI003D7BE32F
MIGDCGIVSESGAVTEVLSADRFRPRLLRTNTPGLKDVAHPVCPAGISTSRRRGVYPSGSGMVTAVVRERAFENRLADVGLRGVVRADVLGVFSGGLALDGGVLLARLGIRAEVLAEHEVPSPLVAVLRDKVEVLAAIGAVGPL